MTGLWKLLNSPLILVLIGISLWSFLSNRAVSPVHQTREYVKTMTDLAKNLTDQQRKTDSELIEVSKLLTINEVRIVPTEHANRIKVIGQLTNQSSVAVKQLHLVASFRNADGTLVDVLDVPSYGIGILSSKQSLAFAFERYYKKDSPEFTSLQADRADVRVGSFKIAGS